MPEAETVSAAEQPATPVEEVPARNRWRRMPVWLRIILGFVAAIFLAWLVLFVTKGRFLKHPFEKIVGKQIEREVKVAGDFQLYFNWFNVKFVADGLSVANPAWRGGQLFTSKHIDTRLRTWPLILGRREMMWLNLDGAKVDLAWDKLHQRNTWTFGDPNKKGKPFELPHIERTSAVGSHVDYLDPKMRLEAHIDIATVAGQQTRITNDVRFTGNGRFNDKPFQLKGGLLSPNEMVGGGENKLTLTAWGLGQTVTVDGTLTGATVIDGAKLATTARGDNIAHLFDFIGVAVPETRAYRMAATLVKQGGNYDLTNLRGIFGTSDIAGRVSVKTGERVYLSADLKTRSLDILDAGPFFGWNAQQAAKTGAVVGTVAGTPRVLPDAPLKIEAIKQFDADVKYHVTAVRAKNLPVSNIDLTLGLDHSLLKLSPLTLDLAGGKLWSDISINARVPQVVTAYDIKLSPTPMGKLLGRFGVEESGTTGTLSARIKMSGTGDSVRSSLATSNGRIAVVIPKGSFWTRNIQLAEIDIGTYVTKLLGKKLKKPVDINCGLVAFTVRNGIAAADPILIDTTKNVIVGRGGFSFRTEALDLAFRADGKTISLFSGQSPVGVNGVFAKPGFQIISPQLLTRAGVGLGLLALAPPAAVLAFVDVGDAKSAACGPVLSAASASAQKTTGGKPRDDVGKGTTAKSKSGKTTGEERKDQRKKFLGIF
ncbi:AsmA domain-containing protein [Sphingomonas antarctica]|uniref:AsmA family protein n=1 Tax=Sphingomonas antarctica TaxID=2040274 RepID=UPI0039ECD4EC